MDSSALLAIALPAAVVLAVRGLLALVRPSSADAAGLAAVFAVAVAIPVALALVGLRAGFPIGHGEDGWLWLVWLVPAGALLGLLEARSARLPLLRTLVPAVGALLASTLLLEPLRARHAVLFSALPMVALWSLLAWPEGDGRRRAIAVSTVVACVAAAPIMFRGAHSIDMATFAAVLASALIGSCFSPRCGIAPLPRAMCGVLAMGFGGLLAAASAYQRVGDFNGFPATSALSLAAAAAVGAFVPTRLGRVGAPAAAAGAALALAAVSAWTSGAFRPYEVWW